jgi:NAD(P)H-dependent FMN reductase
MNLLIINGSPRGLKSNSEILMRKFTEGYCNVISQIPEQLFLAKSSDKSRVLDEIVNAKNVIVIFPLYTDCMPGIVMQFFENVYESGILNSKNVGFVVQSGFPESKQSVFVERYLEKLCKRLNCNYLGTVIKAGVEGIQIQPPSMTKKLFSAFTSLGEEFAKTGKFDRVIKDKLMGRYEFSGFSLSVVKAMSKTSVFNMYWNKKLKEHSATAKKYDRPYSENE